MPRIAQESSKYLFPLWSLYTFHDNCERTCGHNTVAILLVKSNNLYFCVPAETERAHYFFCSEKYSFGPTRIQAHDFLINRHEP